MIGWRELLIILVIVLLVFGTRKLTNIGKDLGGAIKGFKEGMREGDQGALGNDASAKSTDDAKTTSRGDGNPG